MFFNVYKGFIMKYLFIFSLFFAVAVSGAERKMGTVTAGVLNVRVKPSAKSDTVLQLKRGDEVAVIEKGKEWTAIRPPENSSLYVSSALISDGKLKSAANLRSGPGVNFQSLGILPKGTAVTVLADKNSWSRIGVPDCALKCYVASAYIKFEETKPAVKNDAAEKKVIAEKTPAAPAEKTVSKNDIVSFSGENFRKLQKNYLKGSARNITVEGTLNGPAKSVYGNTYILYTAQKDYHIAGVIPGNIDMKKKVQIQGVCNIIPGWDSPVIEIKKISQK